MFLRFLFMNQSFYISFRLKQRRKLENRKFNLQTHVRSYFSPKQFLQHLFQPGASLPLAVLLFLFSCCNSLHCRPLSWTPLPFDWEVNGKELEKPTVLKGNIGGSIAGRSLQRAGRALDKKQKHNRSSLFCRRLPAQRTMNISLGPSLGSGRFGDCVDASKCICMN